MTTYDTAYCVSLGRDISAKEANKYTLDGTISKGEQLYCCKNCSLVLTCVNRNIDFSKKPNKIRPYYANRKHGQHHSENCDRIERFINNHKKNKIKQQLYYFTDDNTKLIFDFDPINGLAPESISKVNNTTSLNSNESRNIDEYENESMSNRNLDKKNRIHHTRMLQEIVDLWEAYNEFDLKQKLYYKDKTPISWDDLFILIQGTAIDEKAFHIYYGQAFCIPIKKYVNNKETICDDEVKVSFSGEKATLGKISGKPRVIVHKSQLAKHKNKTLFNKFLAYAKAWDQDHTDSSSYFTLYYLGKFKKITINKNKSDTNQEKISYISLDYSDPNFAHNMVITPNSKF